VRYDEELRPKMMMMTSIKKMGKMVEVDNVVCCGPPLTSALFPHNTTTHCITTGEGEAF